jgi:hypothetical protein
MNAANPPHPPSGMVCVGYEPKAGRLEDSEGRLFLTYRYAPIRPRGKPRTPEPHRRLAS